MSFRVCSVKSDSFLARIFSVLPSEYLEAFLTLSDVDKMGLSEIRLRENMPSSFTVLGRNIPITLNGKSIKSSSSGLSDILLKLTQGSLYSYSEQLSKGFISVIGTRIGVSGVSCNSTESSCDFERITALNIRIPRQIPNAADTVCEYLENIGVENGMGILVISPPNCGKTTFLRALARRLSHINGKFLMRICIVDERGEIFSEGFFENCLADCISYAPKCLSAEIASRTLSSQVLIFDEIGNEKEAGKLEAVCNSGVYVAASVHGVSLEEISRKDHISSLLESGIFKTVYTLSRCNGQITGRITDLRSGNTYA